MLRIFSKKGNCDLNFRKISFLITIFFLFSMNAFSQAIPAEDIHVTTPVYHPQVGKIDYPLGTYNYTVSWQGIPAAEASITVDQDGFYYNIKASANTYSGVDIFYKLRYSVLGKVSSVDFTPVKTEINHFENSKEKSVNITYLDNGDIKAVRSQVGKNSKSIVFDPKNFTLEPISSGLLARGIDWHVGKTIELDTFNGKSRYLIRLTCKEKASIEVNDKTQDVWVISPSVTKLTDPDSPNKLREANIYLTADEKRDVLLIESEVFIGTVKTSLDSFQPLPKQGGQTVAQIVKYKLS
jgi:hypothetical protein